MQFYFQVDIQGKKETLALCSLYSPVEESLRQNSHNALNVCNYEGQGNLVVIRANSILSVVAMVPFGEQHGGIKRFFLVEKFAMGVVDTGDL